MPRKNKNKTLNHTTTKNKENTETKAIKLAKKGKWLLFYGGTDGERKSVADKAHCEAWKEIKKKFQLSDIQRLLRIQQLEIGNKPPTIDLSGHDGSRIEKRLLGNIEGIDISENPYSWLKKTGGRLYDLYFIPGLVVHNINCKYIETIKLLLPILEKIKVSTNKSSPTPHLGLVMSLENLKCLSSSDNEDLLDRLRWVFEIVEFDSEIKKTGKVKKENFDDVKLKITIGDDNNLKNSIINIHISINDADYEKLELEDRILPVLYLLARGVKHGKGLVNNLVTNNVLKKGYEHVDEAKYKIVKSFSKHVSKKRAGKIIEVEHRVGKRLLIPKKNITINKLKSSS